MFGLHPKAEVGTQPRHVRLVPILLRKSAISVARFGWGLLKPALIIRRLAGGGIQSTGLRPSRITQRLVAAV